MVLLFNFVFVTLILVHLILLTGLQLVFQKKAVSLKISMQKIKNNFYS